MKPYYCVESKGGPGVQDMLSPRLSGPWGCLIVSKVDGLVCARDDCAWGRCEGVTCVESVRTLLWSLLES